MKIITILANALIMLAIAIAPGNAKVRDWTDQQYRDAFDEVARNYGAAEYAVYTFMVENHRSPNDLQELFDSGHLNVKMTNPYTGCDVVSLKPTDIPDGFLAGNMYLADRDDGKETHLESYYVRNDNPPMVHSMIKRIYLYTCAIDFDLLFNNDRPRAEQMTAVYCRQAIDAMDSFQQKIGTSPDSFEDMYIRGDVNVHYINPFTGEVAVSSEELSPGDFFYRKEKDNGYTILGWGSTGPVFFACTDDDAAAELIKKWPDLTNAYDEIKACPPQLTV